MDSAVQGYFKYKEDEMQNLFLRQIPDELKGLSPKKLNEA